MAQARTRLQADPDIAARAAQLRDSILEKRDQAKKEPDTPVFSFARPF
jgi:hypothetical protein